MRVRTSRFSKTFCRQTKKYIRVFISVLAMEGRKKECEDQVNDDEI